MAPCNKCPNGITFSMQKSDVIGAQGVTKPPKLRKRVRFSPDLPTDTVVKAKKAKSNHSAKTLFKAKGGINKISGDGKSQSPSQSLDDEEDEGEDTSNKSITSDDAPRKLVHATGPSHFAAQDVEQDLLKKYKEKRKRRISQLYTGEVYHHDLTTMWDHVKDHTKFYDLLDELTKEKYIISPKIAKKMAAIKARREKKELKKLKREANQGNCIDKQIYRIRKAIMDAFAETNFGYVFKTTPRYYKMTPVVPIHCRRCRYLLEDTLETRWTPLGIIFALMFPILGLLCCLSYREFVCVVCEEIYVYGDYPARCRPLDKTKLGSDTDVKFKKRSFDRNWILDE